MFNKIDSIVKKIDENCNIKLFLKVAGGEKYYELGNQYIVDRYHICKVLEILIKTSHTAQMYYRDESKLIIGNLEVEIVRMEFDNFKNWAECLTREIRRITKKIKKFRKKGEEIYIVPRWQYVMWESDSDNKQN